MNNVFVGWPLSMGEGVDCWYGFLDVVVYAKWFFIESFCWKPPCCFSHLVSGGVLFFSFVLFYYIIFILLCYIF